MKTKDKIIYTTIEIIAKDGIHFATAGNIAKEAELTKSNIFYYFKNIDELLLSSLKKSLYKISPLLKPNYKDFDNIEDYLNESIVNLMHSDKGALYLKVILSFAHQTMYLKDFLRELQEIIIDDIDDVLVKAIIYFKDKDLSSQEILTLASLIMTTFNGLGVILLIDGKNNKFVDNWKLQTSLINNYIKKKSQF